jgi:hypothetical protein
MSRGRVIWCPPVTLSQRDEDGEVDEEKAVAPFEVTLVVEAVTALLDCPGSPTNLGFLQPDEQRVQTHADLVHQPFFSPSTTTLS